TAGNTPSGSSPESVKASVWHSAVWVIFTSTSPCFGPSRSSSTICSGLPGSKATAARVFMGGSCNGGGVCRADAAARPPGIRVSGSPEVRADQAGHLGDALGALGVGAGGMAELLAQVRFEHLAHQAVDRAPDRRDLLQHRAAVGPGFQRTLEALAL